MIKIFFYFDSRCVLIGTLMVNQFSLYFMQSFSVLLSLYHKESALFLHQSLESVFAQTLLPTEVILVEDGPLSEALHAVVK